MSDPVSLTAAGDVTDEVLAAALDIAQGEADWQDDRLVIEWERVYDQLESGAGFFVTEMDSPADRKIRRHVLPIVKGIES